TKENSAKYEATEDMDESAEYEDVPQVVHNEFPDGDPGQGEILEDGVDR
ncbi:MAG: hypothetical protein GTO63_19680, partial [Anaerolineae bacterium]|nr:hypothetical protein [Anaerolineae bacterium]NIN96991.1 hypothetical protein [Anaerolineae bacterium]NIQ79946.1 hypothetical protein [Anaerolineae bacterium]